MRYQAEQVTSIGLGTAWDVVDTETNERVYLVTRETAEEYAADLNAGRETWGR